MDGGTGDGGAAHHDANSDADPSRVTTPTEFAAALRELRLRRGEPSLRELERRARSPAAVAAGTVALSRTTLSGVLSGERFPSHEVLIAFLDALGVTEEAQQREWTAAWERLARRRDGPPPAPEATASPMTTTATAEPRPRSRRRRRAAAGLIAAVAITAVIIAAIAEARSNGRQPPVLTTTLDCVPADCNATGPTLILQGRLTGPVPLDRRVVVMIVVDRTQRWYLGPTVVGDEVEWTRQIGVGNPEPQPSDRYFTVCVHLIPAGDVERLTTEMITQAGQGLSEQTLPSDRVEMACTPAVRPAGT